MGKISKKIAFILATLFFILPLFGCSEELKQDLKNVSSELAQEVGQAVKDIGKLGQESIKELGKKAGSSNTKNTVKVEDANDYVFTDYYALNGFAEIVYKVPAVDNVVYGNLDKYGRPTYVIANLNYNTIKRAKQRGRLPINVDPAGWNKNEKVVITEKNGQSYKGYFYNRSHMLADSLGGEPIKENLVTGTRTQNVGIKNQGGMAYTEIQARDFFVVPTDETLIYQVRPVYNGDELLPRYVIVDIKSSDRRIDEQVIVDNSANGYEINYSNGEFKKL